MYTARVDGRVHGPYTDMAVYTARTWPCTWSSTCVRLCTRAVETARVHSPCTRPFIQAVYTRLYTDRIQVYTVRTRDYGSSTLEHDRIQGLYMACTQPCTQPCTRPCTGHVPGRVHGPVHGGLHGRVRCCVYGPCPWPCTGSVQACLRVMYRDVYMACTRPCTRMHGRVDGLVQGRVRRYTSTYTHVYTALYTTVYRPGQAVYTAVHTERVHMYTRPVLGSEYGLVDCRVRAVYTKQLHN